MAREKPLNSNQRAVLEWISNGCPAGVLPDYGHRIVAKALETRGLVSISGRGLAWKASMTSVGILRLSTELVLPDYSVEAERLWRRALAEGGQVQIEGTSELRRMRLLQAAQRSPARPIGKALRATLVNKDGETHYDVSVIDHFPEQVPLHPVPVPKTLKDCHKAVDAYVKDRDWHCVSKNLVTRAALILQAIAMEGERRSFKVKNGVKNRLLIETIDGAYEIRILEVPGAGGATKSGNPWQQSANLPEWEARRQTIFIPTGRLEIRVNGPSVKYSGDVYRDAKARKVEDRLPEVFRSFEAYAIEGERERYRRAEDERVRRSEWEGAMQKAREAYADHVLWESLKQQLAEWKEARELQGFLDEMKITIDAMQPGLTQEHAFEWYHWARARTVDADPLANRIHMPKLATPRNEDLKPFLSGRSPYFEPLTWR